MLRGRYGGGCEVLRGGGAKCIVVDCWLRQEEGRGGLGRGPRPGLDWIEKRCARAGRGRRSVVVVVENVALRRR